MQFFNSFPPHSKVWIYQCNRPFTVQEHDEIAKICNNFTAAWKAHDNQLTASSEIFFNRFLVFVVNEAVAGASGCSIDKSVNLVKEIEKRYNLFLLNRMQVAYIKSDQVSACPLNDFIELYKSGQVDKSTIIFNNLVANNGELNSGWMIPVEQSWIMTYLPTEKITAS